MKKVGKFRTRRLRRALKAVLKFGVKAKPRHTSKSGRTGNVASVHRKGRCNQLQKKKKV